KVRLNAAHRDCADPALAQPCVEIDISVKRGVHRLDNAQIGLAGNGVFQLEAGRAALERSTRPIVLDEHDRVAAPTPRGNQPGDGLLGRGIVAGSKRWILEAALNVHHQERTLFAHASDLIDRRAVRPNVANQSGCSAGRSISTNGTSPHPSRNRSLLPVRRNPARSTSPKAGPL